jgi:hypothetical protein
MISLIDNILKSLNAIPCVLQCEFEVMRLYTKYNYWRAIIYLSGVTLITIIQPNPIRYCHASAKP